MTAMTVRELRDALACLGEQDAPVAIWTNRAGETFPHVIETGETRILAISWDHLRGIYVLHTNGGEAGD